MREIFSIDVPFLDEDNEILLRGGGGAIKGNPKINEARSCNRNPIDFVKQMSHIFLL